MTTTRAGYKLSWLVPQRVMYLRLSGTTTLDELENINQFICSGLEETSEQVALVIDTTDSKGFAVGVEQLRASQRYGQHPRLKSIIVLGSNKLIRLMLVIVFHVATASLKFCQNLDEANTLLKHRGFIS
jgi:hypothetical protein